MRNPCYPFYKLERLRCVEGTLPDPCQIHWNNRVKRDLDRPANLAPSAVDSRLGAPQGRLKARCLKHGIVPGAIGTPKKNLRQVMIQDDPRSRHLKQCEAPQ